MTPEMIKKEVKKALKETGLDMVAGLTMGKKQMEKGTAVIGFGFLEDESRDAEGNIKKFVNSDCFRKLDIDYSIEIKADGNWHYASVRLHY